MSKSSCDPDTEFECTSGGLKCILRSSVNDHTKDCSDGSDENVMHFDCFEYELSCVTYALQSYEDLDNSDLDISLENVGITENRANINRCISYEMVRNSRQDCSRSNDETFFIQDCTHYQLFLCLDQSRCLPKRLQCNGVINCIDGSDEIEGCKINTTVGRYSLSLNKTGALLSDLSNILVIFTNESFSDILNVDKSEILKRSKRFYQNNNFGLKCKTFIHNDYFEDNLLTPLFNTVPQPSQKLSNKTFCANEEDKCLDKLGKFNCFRCFNKAIILKSQVCDGIIDCRDLSDECACEKSKVKQLCDVFYNNNRLYRKQIEFDTICDLHFDLPDGIDEKFCNIKILFYNYDHFSDNFIETRKCAKGKTAFNRSVYVASYYLHDVSFLLELFSDSTRKLYNEFGGGVERFQPKKLDTSKDLYGSCYLDFDCPYLEDECSQDCFSYTRASTFQIFFEEVDNLYLIFIHFIICFEFLFKNSKTVLITGFVLDEISFHDLTFYFNSSVV